MEELALYGGPPLRKKEWPTWPSSDPDLEKEVVKSLRSNRWTISGFYKGRFSYEEQFSNAFKVFNNSSFCIPTANGTSALVCALQALGVSNGDEVIVPGLTWVACAVAVEMLNATPIFVDIEESTLCLSTVHVEKAITERTKAIMVVHLYSSIADMDGLLKISEKYRIPLIEDCAQAHGAEWRGKKVGTIGAIGTFSMQQGKILTSGEGGACITDDPLLAEKIYLIRTNGRYKMNQPPEDGQMELVEKGVEFASNYCLSEIQCAILLNQLKKLDYQNEVRHNNKLVLQNLLKAIGGIELVLSSPGTDKASIYHLPFRINLKAFNCTDIFEFCKALSAELQIGVHPPYVPLDKHPLYASKYLVDSSERINELKSNFKLPACWEAHKSIFLLHHSMLLADEGDMLDIAEAIIKIKAGMNQRFKQ